MSSRSVRFTAAFLLACAPVPAALADTGEVQRALAAVGCYDGPVDGKASLALRSAIRCFQRDGLGATPDGTLSPEEERALIESAAAGFVVERGARYEPEVPRGEDMPVMPTPLPTPVVDPMDEFFRRTSEEWRRYRDEGQSFIRFGDMTCFVEDIHGGMSHCMAYLAETAPEGHAVFCAGQLGYRAFRGPGTCRALGGRAVPPFRTCMRPADENDPSTARLPIAAIRFS